MGQMHQRDCQPNRESYAKQRKAGHQRANPEELAHFTSHNIHLRHPMLTPARREAGLRRIQRPSGQTPKLGQVRCVDRCATRLR